MKLNCRLNQLTEAEYWHLLANYCRYTDFNSLGLFRSLLENGKLSLVQRQQLRDAAIAVFPKFYEFLQLKDPTTYLQLSSLGQELTVADERAAWEEIKHAQQRILTRKQLGHRNFGTYSRHNCPYDTCPYNGLMIRQNSRLAEGVLRFHSDRRIGWGHYNHQTARRHQQRKAWAQGREQHDE
ncbi:hypothetical protein [Hymenobacter canadensis]|uniref:Uncharacterized protein n=1 Tax=Hymenobacter canadensis TaxID=2999067 RepID=A0ABY7LM64_9BACT|nr:hypothetical protein [Hymenobacter canadensis]WBA40889.1 hypothetical protein O3303_13785 [Hymenobacter canadensis]